MEIAIVALGCFWGPEVKFSKLDGVLKTEVGYCGGNSSKTNYKEVCTGSTNHAEVVKLEFDPNLISYEKAWKKTFPPYNKILKGKEALYELTDEEMSFMARCLPEELSNMSPLQKLGIGLKILVRRPVLLTKKIISVLRSFGYSRAKYFGW